MDVNGDGVVKVFELQDLRKFDFYRMDQLAIIRNTNASESMTDAVNVMCESIDTPRWVPKK